MLYRPPTVRGFLASRGLDPEIMVRFQYNPKELKDRRTVNYASESTPGQILPMRQYTYGGDRTLSFSVVINGLLSGESRRQLDIEVDEDGGITPELNKYRAFLYPRTERWRRAGSSFAPLYAETQDFHSPPTCVLGLGEGRVIDCIVTAVTIDEVLFNSDLSPLRAEVSVELVELAPYGGPDTPPLGGG